MTSLSFTPITFFHFLSIIIGAVVLGLAIVNFGVLSIWINSTAASLALIYHITILLLNWRRNHNNTPITHPDTTSSEKHTKRESFPPNLKMPTYPSQVYSPPPPPPLYEPKTSSLIPNRPRPNTHIIIPNTTKKLNNNILPYGPFYTLISLFSIIAVTIITLIGFGMTLEVSIHGAKSLLPAERAKGMTFPWNMNIQKAQCTFLGAQLFLSIVVLVLCAKGRDAITRKEEERKDEIEYGFVSPETSQSPVQYWIRDAV